MQNDRSNGRDRLESLLVDYHEALVTGCDPSRVADPESGGHGEEICGCLESLEAMRRECVVPSRLHDEDLPEAVPGILEIASGNNGQQQSSTLRIGRFEIRRILGQGGHGIVYLARDTALGREVALKVARPETLASSELRQRFLLESRTVAELNHPNIIPIYEVGDLGPACYIASHFCSGPTLQTWLTERADPVPIRLAAQFTRTLAATVEFVHRRGIVHRDIKPSNILLGPVSGDLEVGSCSSDDLPFTPKLTDFGLARVAEKHEQGTRTGTVLGTPAYMAPEQAAGLTSDIGPGTDIYALGNVLYELLIGRPAIQGESDLDTLRRIAEGAITLPRRLRHEMPRDLEAICLKCLEFDAARRYASADQLAQDLTRFLDGQPVTARRIGPVGRLARWSRRKPVIASLTLALAFSVIGGGIGVVSQWRAAESHRVEAEENFNQAHRAVSEFHDILFDSHEYDSPAVQPLRNELMQAALKYHEDFVERSDDPELRADVADAYFHLGFMSQSLGDDEQALEYFRASVPLWEALNLEEQKESDFRYYLAKTHEHIGQLLHRDNQLDAAREEFQAAVSIREDQFGSRPHDATAQRELAASYHDLGALEVSLQNLNTAAEWYERELELRIQSCRGEPDNPTQLRELAGLHRCIGSVERLRGQPQAARLAYERARSMLQQMVDELSDLPWSVYELAATDHALGAFLRSLGETEAALQHLELADESFTNLVYQFPDVESFQYGLGDNQYLLGIVNRDANRFDEAVDYLEQAREELENLVKNNPGNWKARRTLASVHCSLGNTLRTSEQLTEDLFDAALTNYQSAGAIYASLAESNLGLDDIQRRQSSVHRGRGALYLKAGDLRRAEGQLEEALFCYQQSQSDYERAAELDFSNTSISAGLARVTLRIADLDLPVQ